MSFKSYFAVPIKSACPGLGTTYGSISLSFQFSQSLFLIRKAIGAPVEILLTTPEDINTSSLSIFIRPPEPVSFCLLFK